MTPLERLIRDTIRTSGPMPVHAYMALALGHPEHGYYMQRDPLGRRGDFITAPEIAQVFGELIGLWAAVTWQQHGAPKRLVLAECGPGRGTLMRDALRAAKTKPDFMAAVDLNLVETSPVLRALQKGGYGDLEPTWHGRIDTLPDGPLLLIANEFLDALPIRQLVRTELGWAERVVDVVDGRLAFRKGAPAPDADDVVSPAATFATPGEIYEVCPDAIAFADTLGRRIAQQGGAALLIDYGHDGAGTGETLQAVRKHRPTDPLDAPGEADLTAHVDFEAFANAVSLAGARCHGPVPQGRFLLSLGARERTERLAAAADDDQRKLLETGFERLIADGEMGTLFKVLAVTAPHAPSPPGF